MEGYWLTHYEAGAAHGDGIAVLHEGELLGGDLERVWSGTYEEQGPKVYAHIRIVPRVTTLEEETMAREKPIILSLQGHCTEHYARLVGHEDGREDLPFQVTMRKCRAAHAARMLTKRAA